MGASVRPKNLKKCMRLNWTFQRGGEGVPSVGEVWIFSGITQSHFSESSNNDKAIEVVYNHYTPYHIAIS